LHIFGLGLAITYWVQIMTATNDVNYWISSDHHFFHKRILEYQADTRPFNNLDEMHAELIKRHNEKVSPNDMVFFLGDFSFGKAGETLGVLRQMNGIKHFIVGNHDKVILNNQTLRDEFVWVKDIHELKIPNYTKKFGPIVLCHYPIYSWNRMHYGAPHFYGHTHGSIPVLHDGQARDIGADTSDCYPLNIIELADKIVKAKKAADPRNRSSIR